MASDGRQVQPTVVVFSGGDEVPPRSRSAIPRDAYVIAADSGLDHARAMGRPVDLVVGDLDSVSPTSLASARSLGTEVREHETDKDQTDLELALDAAFELTPQRVVVVGGHGGRVDHFLGNAMLVARAVYASAEVEVIFGDAQVHVVHGTQGARSIEAVVGQTCTLLAVHGAAEGIRTEGLRWELAGEQLEPGSSRGVSNEVVGGPITVELEVGSLLVVFPGAT